MSDADKLDVDKLIEQYQEDKAEVEKFYPSWEAKEKIILSVPYDAVSVYETKSKVVDPTLLTSIIRQNNSLMAQLPTGKVIALSSQNKGKSILMDLIFHNQILPHANLQFDVFTKFWLLSFYRKVYGSFGVLVDFVTHKNYSQPDFSLIPIRNLIPQRGKVSVEDSDYIFVRSYVTKEWLKRRDKNIWKNIDELVASNEDNLKDQSFVEKKTQTGKGEKYELITKYEHGRWETFSPKIRKILRDIKNPQNNDELPVVMCYAYPLIDRFFGLGEFERGETLHLAASSLINLYLDGVKLGIFPRFKIDPMYIENWDDFDSGLGPGQIILMKRGFFDALEQIQGNPAGLQTFQSTYNFLKGAIMTVANTTDTTLAASADVNFGRTPQALRMQEAIMGAQTNFDRRMLEKAIEKIYDRMIDLMVKVGKKDEAMTIYLKKDDLQKIADINSDVLEMFEYGDMGKITIKHQEFADVEYRYELDSETTMKKDAILENASLEEILAFISKLPNVADALVGNGIIQLGSKQLDLGELIKRWIITKGISDWNKIIIDNPNGVENVDEKETQEENTLNMANPQIANNVQDAFSNMQITDPQIAKIFNQIQNDLYDGGGNTR
jgi:hypothetical protein